jgi:predicted transcriptional regulator
MSPRAACRLERLGFADVYDYVPGKAAWLAMGLPSEGSVPPGDRAGPLARGDVPTCAPDEEVDQVSHRMAYWNVCVVVADDVVLGVLDADGLAEADSSTAVEDVMRAGPSTFRPSITKRELAEWMDGQGGIGHTLITTLDGRLVGLVTRDDL